MADFPDPPKERYAMIYKGKDNKPYAYYYIKGQENEALKVLKHAGVTVSYSCRILTLSIVFKEQEYGKGDEIR